MRAWPLTCILFAQRAFAPSWLQRDFEKLGDDGDGANLVAVEEQLGSRMIATTLDVWISRRSFGRGKAATDASGRARRDTVRLGGHDEDSVPLAGTGREWNQQILDRSVIMRADKMYANLSHAWFLTYGLSSASATPPPRIITPCLSCPRRHRRRKRPPHFGTTCQVRHL